MRNLVLAVAAGVVASCGTSALAGPDVIVGDLHEIQRFGSQNNQQAYAVGTVSCNIGDVNLRWISNTNQHPVIGQNLYRLKDGKFEQLGQSWLKHGFFALSQSLCGRCNATDGSSLGVGCSDPYSASLNGSQSGLGPRYQVNPYTGNYPYPVTGVPSATGQMRRLLVNNSDVDPALNAGARYFAEGQYVTPDDAAAGNGFNNCSYREVRFTGSGQNFTPSFVAGQTTRRMVPGVRAWAANDAAVTVTEVRVPGEGAFWVAYKVTQQPNGTWFYDYAIQNVNSDRAGGALRVNVPGCDSTSEQTWRGVAYHSGEIWSNDAWVTEKVGAELVWRSPQSYAENANTNALRWGTMYNFRYVSTRAPRVGQGTLELFKPAAGGAPASIQVPLAVPSAVADFNADGFVDFHDFDAYVEAFESGGPGTDTNGDGFVDFFDYDAFVQSYEAGC